MQFGAKEHAWLCHVRAIHTSAPSKGPQAREWPEPNTSPDAAHMGAEAGAPNAAAAAADRSGSSSNAQLGATHVPFTFMVQGAARALCLQPMDDLVDDEGGGGLGGLN